MRSGLVRLSIRVPPDGKIPQKPGDLVRVSIKSRGLPGLGEFGCVGEEISCSIRVPDRVRTQDAVLRRIVGRRNFRGGCMSWTKPEFKEVAVTLEVTAYAARR
jgi:coenzyme PQQ precursor peptide PqqA